MTSIIMQNPLFLVNKNEGKDNKALRLRLLDYKLMRALHYCINTVKNWIRLSPYKLSEYRAEKQKVKMDIGKIIDRVNRKYTDACSF